MSLPLFDQTPAPYRPYQSIPAHVEAEAQPRLSRQNQAVLARLQRGPATNRELAEIALKYTGRISELRDAGYDVVLVSEDRKTGLAVYELRGK